MPEAKLFTKAGRRAPVVWLISWLALWVSYLALVGSLKPAELVAGLLAAAAGSVLLGLARAIGFPAFRPVLSWFWALRVLPWAMVWETWLLTVALWRRLVLRQPVLGASLEVSFPYKSGDKHYAARVVLMTLGVCITPNSYLVNLDREAGIAHVRQLVGRKLSKSDQAFINLP